MFDVTKGAEIAYRSFAGETWPATILAVGPPGFVDIAVSGPGLIEPMELHAIRWSDDPAAPLPGATCPVCDNSNKPRGI